MAKSRRNREELMVKQPKPECYKGGEPRMEKSRMRERERA